VAVIQLYEELFEIPFFESSTEFYKEEAVRLREGSDCCTFMWRVSLVFTFCCGFVANLIVCYLDNKLTTWSLSRTVHISADN